MFMRTAIHTVEFSYFCGEQLQAYVRSKIYLPLQCTAMGPHDWTYSIEHLVMMLSGESTERLQHHTRPQ